MDRLEAELYNVDSHLEVEHLRLARGWLQLEVAINFSRLQHEATRLKDEESSATAKEACDRAFDEAEATDRRREAAEKCEQELLASIPALERQAWEREAIVPIPAEGLSVH